MFLTTRRRLTALNSLVFLLIFIIFTSTLYSYLHFRLFSQIDSVLISQASSVRLVHGHIVPLGRHQFNPRVFILLQGSDGRMVSPDRFPAEIANVEEIAATVSAGSIESREYEGHVFRIANVPYRYSDNKYNVDSTWVVTGVFAVSVVDPEVEILQSFLVMILSGGLVSTLAILIAGYLLAKKAMIPIQAAWERQQQFVSDASHELRSPITGIYSNAELLLRHPERSIGEERQRLTTILQESTRMTNLISSLLTLARADANKAELHLSLVDISKVAEAVVSSFRPREELQEICLAVNLEPELYVMADKDRIHQLMVILLDNAFSFTPTQGEIQVRCYRADRHILLRVADTGPGILPQHIPRIFDRFFRGDKSRSRKNGGTGLGLAIAKWIVEKHKGKIAVESEMGQGTIFTVYLPGEKG
ncbi:MAG: sasA 17 [Firmicutes bacterium]|nr:sasA 17 [Bacillota bacterium]